MTTDFEHDAFISYAHNDDLPGLAQEGWVTKFGKVLHERLTSRLGQKARIWIDPSLKGNETIDSEIMARLGRSALLVSILSPSYVQSAWCQREVNEFCAAAARTGGHTLGTASRVVKVVKLPAEPEPEPMRGAPGYNFYANDHGFPMELQPDSGGSAGQDYLVRITRLAYEITLTLQMLRQTPATAATRTSISAAGQLAVFLAHCGRDLQEAHDRLAVELRAHGHQVLQLQPPPETEEALQRALPPLLARCALSVHLVGDSVGPVPGGPSGRSLAMLQNSLAAEHCRHGRLRRIIWLPAEAQGERPEQRAFINELLTSADAQRGADLLRRDIEAVKTTVHERLRQLAEPPPSPPAARAPTAPPVVHLMMSEADREAAVPLIRLLQQWNLEVTVPVFVGTAAALRKANKALILASHAQILFYGAENDLWKQNQIELRKRTIGADSSRPHRVWTCLASPLTEDKKMLAQIGGLGLIDCLGGWTAAAVQPVVRALAAPGAQP